MTESDTLRSRIKRAITTHAIALAVGAVVAFALMPTPEPKIEYREKEKVVTVESTQEAEKWKGLYDEARSKETKTRVITKIVEVEKPSGEKVKTTEIVEANDTKEDTKVEAKTEGERVVKKVVEKVVTRDVYLKQEPVLPQWMVTGMVGVDAFKLPPSPIYGGMVQRRIVGPLYIGLWATTSPMGGIALSGNF